MMIDILNKILLFLLFLSGVNIIRHSFFLLKSFKDGKRFVLDKGSLIVLGMSISYMLLIIIDGIKL
tara:strand:+ start:41 stop:238 length:198 start_codon:yes stop_codon:yes gene_type:complete